MHITWRHVHRQAGANCTGAKLYFWQIFQFFIFIQMAPGPTHPLPNYFWIFGIFLTLQSPLHWATLRGSGRDVTMRLKKENVAA